MAVTNPAQAIANLGEFSEFELELLHEALIAARNRYWTTNLPKSDAFNSLADHVAMTSNELAHANAETV